ncbi:MAG: hypothetical protein L0G99_13335 [Propionibacteriales bacterium]|nr:hypothetical protein [Propionibacteriales bacterium]
MSDLIDGTGQTPEQLRRVMINSWQRGAVAMAISGSALTGAGVDELMALMSALPAATPQTSDDPSALVFKIENDERGRVAWARVFGGTVRHRADVPLDGGERGRITDLRVMTPTGPVSRTRATAGDVVLLRGLAMIRIGDWIGQPRPMSDDRRLAAPNLEAVVDPTDPAQQIAMFRALSELAAQDPLINLRVDDQRSEVAVSLFGEVQKEVIAALLADQFGVDVTFRETTTQHIERILGTGTAHAVMGDGTAPYLATLGFRVEAAPIDTGLVIDLEVELGSMPTAFFAATREGIRTALHQGRHGWPILDARVTITHTGYAPRQSHAHQRFNKAFSSVGAGPLC